MRILFLEASIRRLHRFRIKVVRFTPAICSIVSFCVVQNERLGIKAVLSCFKMCLGDGGKPF
jgi:hypothetical protein